MKHDDIQDLSAVRPTLEESRSNDATPAAAEEEEASPLARHRDPSHVRQVAGGRIERSRSGVVWVRPSELMTQAGGRVAGRGIDFQAELARRARRLPVETVATSRRAISERAHRLPPATAFGRNAQAHIGAARSGIGLR